MSESSKKKKKEITEGRGGARDYSGCLKRRNKREEGQLCLSFFLPAGSRDDGVCPRGRSILLESRGSRASLAAGEEREKERSRVGSLSRGPLATGTLNVGGTAGVNPRGVSHPHTSRTCQPPSHPSPASAPSASLVLSITHFGFLILPLLPSLLLGSSSSSSSSSLSFRSGIT